MLIIVGIRVTGGSRCTGSRLLIKFIKKKILQTKGKIAKCVQLLIATFQLFRIDWAYNNQANDKLMGAR